MSSFAALRVTARCVHQAFFQLFDRAGWGKEVFGVFPARVFHSEGRLYIIIFTSFEDKKSESLEI